MDKQSTSDSDATSQNWPMAKPPKIRKKGSRCIAFGCSNTSYDGFSIHNMPGKMPDKGERFTTLQKAWINFISRKRKFDIKYARTYKRISLCSGHFREEDYETTDVQMYRHGIRTKPPHLKKDAVPTVDVAKQPFPQEWFAQTANVDSNQPSSSSSSSSGMMSPSATPISSLAILSSALAIQPVPATMAMSPQEEEISERASLPSTDSLSGTSDHGDTDTGYVKVKRSRKSMHVMKKVRTIYYSYNTQYSGTSL